MKIDFNDVDVAILCGGLGLRLKSLVKDRPKPMALIDERPFLDFLILYLTKFGYKRFILCIGYKGSLIKNYYSKRYKKLKFIFSEEKEPLGTGGAIKNAERFIKTDPFLVLNGDSFFYIDLRKFFDFHTRKKATVSIALKKISKELDTYGLVNLHSSGKITDFKEKCKKGKSRYVNGGIYLFQKESFSLMPKKRKFSLEEEFFPGLAKKGILYGYEANGEFIDIGTPLRYKLAKKLLRNYKTYLCL